MEYPNNDPLPIEPEPAFEPPVEIVEPEDEEEYVSPFKNRPMVAYRGATRDPAFGYLIALALSVGLMPLIPANADLRYTLIWGIMAGFGVLSWLLGNSARITTETPENLFWGLIFGLIISVPVLMIGGSTLHRTAHDLFPNMGAGAALAYLLFVMPLAETLFMRGVLQQIVSFWVVGLLSSLWSVSVFFPMLDLRRFPAVAVVIGVLLVMMNMAYSYVRERNGLAAAWICQIVVNLTLLFLPFLG
jgi:hypothetical protein